MQHPTLSLETISEEIRPFIERLLQYTSPTSEHSIATLPKRYENHPKPRFAAVLVLLYLRDGKLRVLLTTRSKALRSHPGQAALPGGKSDEEDETPVWTALREASEEINLPLPPIPLAAHIHILTQLPTHLSLFKLFVTPVVAYLSRPDLVLPALDANQAEVSGIFDHPLEAFLDPEILSHSNEKLSPRGDDWIYPEDLHVSLFVPPPSAHSPASPQNTSDLTWLNHSTYRMHRFRSVSTPIKGLTADILILAAQIAFSREPEYERWAPSQSHGFEPAIAFVMEEALTAGAWKVGSRIDGRTDNPPSPTVPPPAVDGTKALIESAFKHLKRREDEDLGPYTPSAGATRTSSPTPASVNGIQPFSSTSA
ncbi:hypothetical protein FRB99_005864 [Tulasnella sp. 403]|nr:hypothetical protein FRB99_005864 [Tulasnella sp. 403]